MVFIDELWEANRENWSTFLANRVDDGMERVIRNYVFGSLSVGCSKMHDSFIEHYRIHRSSQAEAKLERFCDEITIKYDFKKVDELEEFLDKKVKDDLEFWQKEEQYYFWVSHKTEVRNLVRLNNIIPEDADNVEEKIVIERFYELDSFYRHIRNAIAHGQFIKIRINNDPVLLFFDNTIDKKIGAFGTIKISRLIAWSQQEAR